MQSDIQNVITLKDFIPLISAIVGILFLCIGWWVTHKLNAERDRQNKLREIRLQYMIEATRGIFDLQGRESPDSETIKNFEAAFRDIQLFGSKKQIELLKKSIEEYTLGKDDISEILRLLRDSLREELDVEKVSGNMTWFVMQKSPTSNKKKQ